MQFKQRGWAIEFFCQQNLFVCSHICRWVSNNLSWDLRGDIPPPLPREAFSFIMMLLWWQVTKLLTLSRNESCKFLKKIITFRSYETFTCRMKVVQRSQQAWGFPSWHIIFGDYVILVVTKCKFMLYEMNHLSRIKQIIT